VIAARLDAPGDFFPAGDQIVIASGVLGGWLDGFFPWLTRGLLWGRLIVPGLPWVWAVVAVFFLLYLSLNLVFSGAVRACADTLAARPLTTFVAACSHCCSPGRCVCCSRYRLWASRSCRWCSVRCSSPGFWKGWGGALDREPRRRRR
jgi:hypothetical protein